MAQIIKAADTIFDHPAFTDFPVNPGSLQGGRLMSSSPHVDGLFMVGPGGMDVDSANLVKTRNANGDWSFNRTAAGAETYHIRTTISEILRTGETYFLDLFGSGQTPGAAAPDKGVAVLNFFAVYSVTVATLTSATLRLGKTVFNPTSAGGAFTQTDLVVATGIATAINAGGAAQPGTQIVPFQTNSSGTPLVWSKDDIAMVEVEATLVMQNTGVLRFYGLGVHCFFNMN